MKRVSTVRPKCGGSGWGEVVLSQTRPIPRSPDGDKRKLLFHKAAFMLDKQNWTIMLENGLVLGGLHKKHYMGHEVAVTTTKHFTNRP